MNLNPIKEALSKATAGPWEYAKDCNGDLIDANNNFVVEGDVWGGEGNYAIIQHAPEWLASLIEHYEELSADAIVLHWQVEEMQKAIEWLGNITDDGLVKSEVKKILQSMKGETS